MGGIQKRSQRVSKTETKPEMWKRLCHAALDALSDLNYMRDEYQDILDNLPENLLSSRYCAKLEEVCDLDIAGALDTITEASDIDLPLGFGRD